MLYSDWCCSRSAYWNLNHFNNEFFKFCGPAPYPLFQHLFSYALSACSYIPFGLLTHRTVKKKRQKKHQKTTSYRKQVAPHAINCAVSALPPRDLLDFCCHIDFCRAEHLVCSERLELLDLSAPPHDVDCLQEEGREDESPKSILFHFFESCSPMGCVVAFFFLFFCV